MSAFCSLPIPWRWSSVSDSSLREYAARLTIMDFDDIFFAQDRRIKLMKWSLLLYNNKRRLSTLSFALGLTYRYSNDDYKYKQVIGFYVLISSLSVMIDKYGLFN